MDWRLRRATSADAPALSLVAGASFLETFAGVLSAADIVAHVAKKSSPERFAGWADRPGSVVTIAEHPDGGAPIGYTLLTDPEDVGVISTDDIELRRIYTLSLARGIGLGTALMAQVMDDARELGRSRLLLGVLATNRLACAFYERQGFTLAGERRFLVGATWHDDLVYERRI